MGLLELMRRVVGAKPRPPSISRELELTRLQDHLSQTCGGSVIGCNRCPDGFIVPVVNPRPFGFEVAALACASCHGVYGLDEPGRLEIPTIH